MDGTHIGDRIKVLRITRNMTQEEFASRINVAKSTVSAYESGARLPSYDVLGKIADLFYVTTDNLLGRSSTYVVDVSSLTPRQRVAIQDVVTTYQAYNQFCRSQGSGSPDDIYDSKPLK